MGNAQLIISVILYLSFAGLAIYCFYILIRRRYGNKKNSYAKVLYKVSNEINHMSLSLQRPTTKINYLIGMEVEGKKRKMLTSEGIFNSLEKEDNLLITHHRNYLFDYMKLKEEVPIETQ